MKDSFRKAVAKPEQLAEKLRKLIEKQSPRDFVKKRRQKKGDDEKYAAYKDSAMLVGLETAKGAAWLTAGGAQFLLTMARWLALDNVFLRKLEEKNKKINLNEKKKFQSQTLRRFSKSNPNLSAYVSWYMLLGVLGFGGKAAVEKGPLAVGAYKEWRKDREENKRIKGTYAEFLKKMRPITPYLIADLIAKEGVKVDPETGLHVPYLDSKGIPTIGFGSTMLKDGSRVTMKTKPITTEEAYELARWHLEEGETYFVLYCYDVASDYVDVNDTKEALGMGSIIYNSYSKLIENKQDKNVKNRFTELRRIYKEYGYAVPDDLVIKLFQKYPIVRPTSFGKAWLGYDKKSDVSDKLGGFLAGGKGLYWRRWLEAGLLSGDITPDMLLNCPVNGMYEFFCYMGQEEEAFFTGKSGDRKVNKDTYAKFKMWLNNPIDKNGRPIKHWKCVKDYLPADVLAYCEMGECEFGGKALVRQTKKQEKIEKSTYTLEYADAYEEALNCYKSGDYKKAEIKYKELISVHKDNALLYNDLAATYNKLGMYQEAINQAKEILHRIGDKSQYAAAQYNAGFAYEQIGDLEKALKNYELSVANGNLNVKKDVERLKEKMKSKTLSFSDAMEIVNKKSNEKDIVNSLKNNVKDI